VLFADTLSSIGQIATLVAAGAALVTVYFAKRTVAEAEQARKEASTAHIEELGEERKLLETTTSAHEAEMAARDRALATQLALQRLAQLGTITDVLREITDIARDEEAHPPPRTVAGQPLSRIPSRMLQLGAALSVYERIGGPHMKEARALADLGYNAGTQLMQVLGMATTGLSEAVSQAVAHVTLEVPDQ
jgi:hypothetical protein